MDGRHFITTQRQGNTVEFSNRPSRLRLEQGRSKLCEFLAITSMTMVTGLTTRTTSAASFLLRLFLGHLLHGLNLDK